MRPEKAAELLQLDLDDPGCVPYHDLRKAQKLSIEALKVVLKIRHYPFPDEILKLPGETE